MGYNNNSSKRAKNGCVQNDVEVENFDSVATVAAMKLLNFSEMRKELRDLSFIVNHMRHDFIVSTECKLKGLNTESRSAIESLVQCVTEQFLKEQRELEKRLNEVNIERGILIESGEGMMDELVRLTTENDSLKSKKSIQLEIDNFKLNEAEKICKNPLQNSNACRAKFESREIWDELEQLEKLVYSYDFSGELDEKEALQLKLKEQYAIISKLNLDIDEIQSVRLNEISYLKKQHFEEIAQLKNEWSREVANIQNDQFESIEILTNQHRQEMNLAECDISSLRSEMAKSSSDHLEMIKELQNDHLRKMSDLTLKHSIENDKVQQVLLSVRAEVKTLQDELNKGRDDRNTLLSDLNASKYELSQVKDEMNSVLEGSAKSLGEINKLNEELSNLKDNSETEIKRLIEEKRCINGELENIKAEFKEISCINEVLTETIEEVTKIKEVLKEKYEGISCSHEALKNDFDEKEKERSLLKEQNEGLKLELENNYRTHKSADKINIVNGSTSTNVNSLNIALKIEIEKLKEVLFRERKINSLKISELQDQIQELKQNNNNEHDKEEYEKENTTDHLKFNTVDPFTEARIKLSSTHIVNTSATSIKDQQRE